MEIPLSGNGQKPRIGYLNGQRILVIGRRSALLEGVADLLQLAGYRVELFTRWPGAFYSSLTNRPNLAIVDLSNSHADVVRLMDQIRASSEWDQVPVLCISFSGDERIREMQLRSRQNNDARFQYYSHTVLSMDGLLDKVAACLS
jgi:CheY-like chemotaxis protein